MSIEEYEAFDQLCLDGLTFLSRYSQSLEPEAQEYDEQQLASTSSKADYDTMVEESTSSSSGYSTDSTATSFMSMQEYFDRPQTYDALLEKLEQLAQRINRDVLEDILNHIRIDLQEEDLLLLLKLLRCNCPSTGQETTECFVCGQNICPSCSYDIRDHCYKEDEDEAPPGGKTWDRVHSLAAKRVRADCEREPCLEGFDIQERFCTCSSFFMKSDRSCSVGQYCRECIKLVISSLRNENSVKHTVRIGRPWGIEAIGIYWDYECDSYDYPEENKYYCRLCFKKCKPYALNRSFMQGSNAQNEVFEDMVEQWARNWEEHHRRNTANCPYFFFPKESYHLVPVDKQGLSGVGETEAEQNIGEEEEPIDDQRGTEGPLREFGEEEAHGSQH